jgi:hypothetical protein
VNRSFWLGYVLGAAVVISVNILTRIWDVPIRLDSSAATALIGVLLGSVITIAGMGFIELIKRRSSAKPHLALISWENLQVSIAVAAFRALLDAGIMNEGPSVKKDKANATNEQMLAAMSKLRARIDAAPDMLPERVVRAAVLLGMNIENMAGALSRGATVTDVRKMTDETMLAIKALDSACAQR